MPRTLFAERFLVGPLGSEPPEPAGYDEAQGISVTADGRPFIEAGAQLLATRTATFVETEGADTDEGSPALMALHTNTRASGEKADAPPWAHTQTAAPGEPVDYDYAAFLGTVTKAAGESSD